MTTISAIVPVYNGERFIGAALASMLAQSRRPDELIVIDDGSTDATERVVAGSGAAVTYARQPNAGPAAARNHGLSLASGALIAFLDADDLWLPGKLAVQEALLAAHPEAGVVLGRTQGVALDESVAAAGAFQAFWSSRHFLQLGAALFRREAFTRTGDFDATLGCGEDFDWFMRAKESAVLVREHDETVLEYRRHEHNMTNDTARRDRDFLRVLKKAIGRRRARGAA